MDAAGHRIAKTEGREPVSVATNIDRDFVTDSKHEHPAPGDSRTVSAAEGYACWAPIYDHAPNPLLEREERHLLPLLTDLRNKSALDLACGTGRWLERLMTHGCESGVGIDCSSAMLRVAGKKSALRGRLATADCEQLPLPNAAFDLAICSFALGHIRDLESMVRELGRVTKPGADVFISDLHPEAYAHGWRVGFRDRGTAVQIKTLPRATDEIVRAFCTNGFKCETLEPLWLGEPERPHFASAGKSHSFAEACGLPAVLVCHFRRLGSPDRRRAE
jgi:ubiquinone/menaquinone biosynthesis C-methylase UbiE